MKKITHIDRDFYWYNEKWEDVDLSELESIGGNACLQGYQHDLPNLKSISGYACLQGYQHDLPKIPDSFDRVYIEYKARLITMGEYRRIRGIAQEDETIELNGKKYKLID